MVLGVVLGLVVGLAIGVAWYLVRSARLVGAAHVAESRLADAQAAVAEQAVQLKAASDTAAAAETARAVAVSELELVRCNEREALARWEDERNRLAGTFADLSSQALAKNNEQFLALADTKLNEARTAAQGDLDQRQQSIARLLDPLSETLARYELGLRQVELERKGAYEGLSEKLAQLHLGHEQLQTRDSQPGDCAAVSPDARAVGGDPVATRRRDGRHDRALRLRGAGVDHDRRGSPASRHDRAHARGSGHGGRRQGAPRRVPQADRSGRRRGPRPLPGPARQAAAHPRRPAGQEGVLETVRRLPSRWWRSSQETSSCRQPTSPTRRFRSTPCRTACCSPRRPC